MIIYIYIYIYVLYYIIVYIIYIYIYIYIMYACIYIMYIYNVCMYIYKEILLRWLCLVWVLYNLQISRVQTFGPSSLWEATRRKMVQGHVFTNSSTTSAPYVHLDTSRFQTVLPKLEPLGSMTSIKVLWGFWNMFKLVWTIRMWKRNRQRAST